MEGMARAIGAGTIIELEGKSYVLNGLTLEDYGILRNYLLDLRRKAKVDFVMTLQGRVPDDVFNRHLDRAIEEAENMTDVPDAELDAWLSTIEGGARSLWLCLSNRYKDETLSYESILKSLQKQLDGAKLQELVDKRDAATGVDKAGNSLGPVAAAADVAAVDAASTGTN